MTGVPMGRPLPACVAVVPRRWPPLPLLLLLAAAVVLLLLPAAATFAHRHRRGERRQVWFGAGDRRSGGTHFGQCSSVIDA